MSQTVGTEAIAALRDQFPGTERMTYMDVAARGLISRPVRAAMDDYLDQRMLEGGDKKWMFERVEATRALAAKLIGASPDEIGFTKNVSDGINAFAHALPWRAGDNVVLCEALEHPANIFPWHNLARAKGIVVKAVQPEDGRVPLDRVIEAIDDATRVVAVSSVSFSPGFRFPLAKLGAHCRERGVLLVVDAAQSIGVLHTDVEALKVDALAASTQKGLMALYGSGFLYVRRELADDLAPAYLSRPAIAVESGHEASSGDIKNFRLAEGARRFDVGNHNYIAAIALERVLTDLTRIGTQAVEAHACRLARRLAEGLAQAGLPVFGRPDGEEQAHIVSVGHGLSDEHDATGDKDMIDFHDFLIANNVRLTIRRGMLRFSLHIYNNDADVERVLDLARRWKAESGSAAGAMA